MHILLLSSELIPERAGGIASYIATIAPALAARGHEVHVLSCAPEHDRRDDVRDGVVWHRRRLLGGERAATTESYRQTKLRLATSISCRASLASLGTRFDVIESPEWLAESAMVGYTSRTPVVTFLHTPLHVLFSYDVRRFGRDLRIADALERAAVRRARVVTSSSSLLVNRLRADGWLRERARVVPYPVQLDEWRDSASARQTGRSVLVVGRLEPRKAPEVVVDAATHLADISGLEITFVGRSRGFREGKPYGEWVATRAERLGVPARFVSQVTHDEMREHYARSRVVAVPSHFESFSVAALEAMASSRPVVWTSGVGAREVLTRGKAGAEVPTNDPIALAHALRPYLLDAELASAHGTTAHELAQKYCSADIIAEQRERCYQDALAS